MTTAVALTYGDRYLRHSSLAVSEHQFCTVVDDAGIFLACSAQEARNVHEGQNLDVEGVAETNEARCLTTCVAVEHTGQPTRLVGNDTRRTTVEACKTADHVLGVVFVHLHEVAVIHDQVDDLVHVVRLVGVGRNDLVQLVLYAGDIVGALYERSLFHVVLRDEAYQAANLLQRLLFGSGYKVGHTRLGSMHLSATQLLYCYILTSHGLHYLRTGDEHIRVLLGHHDEVGQRGAIYRTTGTRTEDHADLRHYARRQDVTLEDLGIAG